MVALRKYMKVENHELHIRLPDGFDYDEVEVVIMPKNDEIDFWSEDEIESIGKIGLSSLSFEEDDEDYSKW